MPTDNTKPLSLVKGSTAALRRAYADLKLAQAIPSLVPTTWFATGNRRWLHIDIELPEDGIDLDSVERAVIEETLRRTRGNVSRAAEMLGLSRVALRNKLVRHRIDPHRFSRPVGTGV